MASFFSRNNYYNKECCGAILKSHVRTRYYEHCETSTLQVVPGMSADSAKLVAERFPSIKVGSILGP